MPANKDSQYEYWTREEIRINIEEVQNQTENKNSTVNSKWRLYNCPLLS